MDPASHTCTKESRAIPVLTPGAPARDNEITALPLFHTIVAAVAVHRLSVDRGKSAGRTPVAEELRAWR